jgi:hypothetical protein
MMPGVPGRRSHDYVRHGTTGLFAAFNIADGTVISSLYRRRAGLEAGIRAWIENWNQNPRPFAWTKTAEEILDSLAKYVAKISGAGY